MLEKSISSIDENAYNNPQYIDSQNNILNSRILDDSASGLGLDRIVAFLRKAAAPFMGRDDIVDMIIKLAAP